MTNEHNKQMRKAAALMQLAAFGFAAFGIACNAPQGATAIAILALSIASIIADR